MKKEDILVGKVYSFWDDGKYGDNRQYLAIVTRVLSIEDAKRHNTFGMSITAEDDKEDSERRCEHLHSIYEYWKSNKDSHPTLNIYDSDIDFIVECAIPDYDEHLIYFAPSWKGKCLFSFEVQSSWQCGLLDIYNDRIEYLRDDLKEKLLNNML